MGVRLSVPRLERPWENDRSSGNLQSCPRGDCKCRARGGRLGPSLVPECGAVRVAVRVPAPALRPGGAPSGGKTLQAPWAGVFGAPFRAPVLGGEREGVPEAGPPGDPAGKPVRSAPRTPWACCQFLETSPSGRGWDTGTARGLVSEVFPGFQPALRMSALEFCSSRTQPGGEVESSSGLSGVCPTGDWSSGQRGEPSKARGNRVGVPVAVQCIV